MTQQQIRDALDACGKALREAGVTPDKFSELTRTGVYPSPEIEGLVAESLYLAYALTTLEGQ